MNSSMNIFIIRLYRAGTIKHKFYSGTLIISNATFSEVIIHLITKPRVVIKSKYDKQ